jgi:hypothetical protein
VLSPQVPSLKVLLLQLPQPATITAATIEHFSIDHSHSCPIIAGAVASILWMLVALKPSCVALLITTHHGG